MKEGFFETANKQLLYIIEKQLTPGGERMNWEKNDILKEWVETFSKAIKDCNNSSSINEILKEYSQKMDCESSSIEYFLAVRPMLKKNLEENEGVNLADPADIYEIIIGPGCKNLIRKLHDNNDFHKSLNNKYENHRYSGTNRLNITNVKITERAYRSLNIQLDMIEDYYVWINKERFKIDIFTKTMPNCSEVFGTAFLLEKSGAGTFINKTNYSISDLRSKLNNFIKTRKTGEDVLIVKPFIRCLKHNSPGYDNTIKEKDYQVLNDEYAVWCNEIQDLLDNSAFPEMDYTCYLLSDKNIKLEDNYRQLVAAKLMLLSASDGSKKKEAENNLKSLDSKFKEDQIKLKSKLQDIIPESDKDITGNRPVDLRHYTIDLHKKLIEKTRKEIDEYQIKIEQILRSEQPDVKRAKELLHTQNNKRVFLNKLDKKLSSETIAPVGFYNVESELYRKHILAVKQLEQLKKLEKVAKAVNIYCSSYTKLYPVILRIGDFVAGESSGFSNKFSKHFTNNVLSALGISSPLALKSTSYDVGQLTLSLKLGLSYGFSFSNAWSAKVGIAAQVDGTILQGDDLAFVHVFSVSLKSFLSSSGYKFYNIALSVELFHNNEIFIFKDKYHWAAWWTNKWCRMLAKIMACDIFMKNRNVDPSYMPSEEEVKEITLTAKDFLKTKPFFINILKEMEEYTKETYLLIEDPLFLGSASAGFNLNNCFGINGSLQRRRLRKMYLYLPGDNSGEKNIKFKHAPYEEGNFSFNLTSLIDVAVSWNYDNYKIGKIDIKIKLIGISKLVRSIGPDTMAPESISRPEFLDWNNWINDNIVSPLNPAVEALANNSSIIQLFLSTVKDILGKCGISKLTTALSLGTLNLRWAESDIFLPDVIPEEKAKQIKKIISSRINVLTSNEISYEDAQRDAGKIPLGCRNITFIFWRFLTEVNSGMELEIPTPIGLNIEPGINYYFMRGFCHHFIPESIHFVAKVFDSMKDLKRHQKNNSSDDFTILRPDSLNGIAKWMRIKHDFKDSFKNFIIKIADEKTNIHQEIKNLSTYENIAEGRELIQTCKTAANEGITDEHYSKIWGRSGSYNPETDKFPDEEGWETQSGVIEKFFLAVSKANSKYSKGWTNLPESYKNGSNYFTTGSPQYYINASNNEPDQFIINSYKYQNYSKQLDLIDILKRDMPFDQATFAKIHNNFITTDKASANKIIMSFRELVGMSYPVKSNMNNIGSTNRYYWKKDSDYNRCMLCNIDFAFYRRRHHCRQCGKGMLRYMHIFLYSTAPNRVL